MRELTVTYSPEDGEPIRALDGISIDVRPGEIVGILGESGCGKSTLANALLRLLAPHAKCDGGTILIRGRDLLNLSEREVMELLREVGFDHPQEIYSAYPHQLSGGQRQRIAIAQAVSCRPALLIADEPTSKLDATLQTEIVALLSQIRRQHGTAILVISHDPMLFAEFADRIAVMYAGRIVEAGKTAEIFGRPLHPYTQALVRIAASSAITGSRTRVRLPAIEGESPDPACIPIGCRFEPRCSERMDICSRRYPREFMPEPSRPVNCFKYGE